jgi:hypothetical protein
MLGKAVAIVFRHTFLNKHFASVTKACKSWSYVMLLRDGEVPPLGNQKPIPVKQHHAPPGDV